jgi:hypothetical protein
MAPNSRLRRAALIVFAFVVWTTLGAQAVTVNRTKDAMTVRAPGFSFIKGEPLTRLKNGRSLRVDLELDVLPEPGASAAAQTKQTFVLSYDLWEERFAVTMAGKAPRSTAYLTSSAAEAWCLEQLTMSISAMGPLGQDGPFWIRLSYRIPEGEARSTDDNDGAYSLQGLIDVFSPRRKEKEWSHTIEAGPFRLKP